MSKKKPAIKNAAAIIDKFGGIRPMAKKLDVAVTTVQGWKKRGTIPAARRAKIIKTAQDNAVNLGALLDNKLGSKTNENLAVKVTKTPADSAATKSTKKSPRPHRHIAENDPPSAKKTTSKLSSKTSSATTAANVDSDIPVHTTATAVEVDDDPQDVEQLLKEISAEAQLLAQDQEEQYAQDQRDMDTVYAVKNEPHTIQPLIKDGDISQDNIKSNDDKKPIGSFDEKLAELERSAVTKSTWITLGLLAGGLGAAALFLFPNGAQKTASLDNSGQSARIATIEQQVTALQGDISAVKDSQSFLKTIIPADLDDRIAKLQSQTENAVSGVNAAIDRAENLSRGVMDTSRDIVDAATTGDVATRINALEDKVKALRGSPEITAFMSRVNRMGNSFAGQAQIDQALRDMRNAFGAASSDSGTKINTDTQDQNTGKKGGAINTALDKARAQSEALSATFENVPKDDLKAAALLLGMTQFRSTLNRDNVAFDDDLIVLQNLIGDDNPELMTSLAALAPHAQNGVLTPKGLGNELKAVSGDIIISSLKGEDVSIKEKLKARLNGLVKVEKDGALLSGTDTQAALVASENMVQNGNIKGAIETLAPLQGKYGAMLSPWMTKAAATLNAQTVQGKIERSIKSLLPAVTGADAPLYVQQ